MFGGDVFTARGFEFHNYPFDGKVCTTENGMGPYIIYTFAVKNTGDTILTDITISDPEVTVIGGPIWLLAGESNHTTFTATYLLTPEDLAAGSFSNTATVSGRAPDGTIVQATASDTQVFTLPSPGITVNGAERTLTVRGSTPVSATVALDAGPYVGMRVDWWLLALPEQGPQWYYLDAAGRWAAVPAGRLDGFRPAFQGPAASVRLPVPGLQQALLQPGRYRLVFAVDLPDGILNYPAGPILYDTFTIDVRR